MHDIGFFTNIQYANILQLISPTIDTDIHVNFLPTPYLQKSFRFFCSGIYIQFNYADIKYKA